MAFHHIMTEIEIAATPERVWSVLLDFTSYPHWNPFIREISGPSMKGGSLRVTLTLPGRAAMTFSPTVLAAEEGREFRWRGRLVVPGLFDGEHYFRIESLNPERTALIHGEDFSSLLPGTLLSWIREGTIYCRSNSISDNWRKSCYARKFALPWKGWRRCWQKIFWKSDSLGGYMTRSKSFRHCFQNLKSIMR